jgi:hypothetical protein
MKVLNLVLTNLYLYLYAEFICNCAYLHAFLLCGTLEKQTMQYLTKFYEASHFLFLGVIY